MRKGGGARGGGGGIKPKGGAGSWHSVNLLLLLTAMVPVLSQWYSFMLAVQDARQHRFMLQNDQHAYRCLYPLKLLTLVLSLKLFQQLLQQLLQEQPVQPAVRSVHSD